MRRTISAVVVLALGVAACSSGDGDTTATTTDPVTESTVTQPNDDGSTASDPPPDGSRPGAERAGVGIWVPSSLALDTFVASAFEAAPFDVEVQTAAATYDAIEQAATAALLVSDYVVVPATVGQVMVDAGSGVFVGRIFEDDGPAAPSQLGVWLLAPTDVDAQGAVMASDPSIVTAGLRRGASAPPASVDGPPPPPDAQEVIDFISAEELALADAFVQSGGFKVAGGIVKEAALEYGERVGGSVALRSVAKAAGPVAAVLDFLKTTHDFTKAAMELIDAESAARIALYDTGMTATSIISDATVRLGDIETGLIEGTVSATEAQELVESLQRAIGRASSVATDSALDLEELDGEVGAAQILQLRQRRLDEFFERSAEVIDEIEDRPSAADVVVGLGPDRIIHVVRPPELERVAELLFATGAGNESKHSNGRQTVTSEGDTDLLGIGQFWWSAADGGPGLDALLPCGQHGDAHTLCGSRPYDGRYLVVLAHLGAPVDFDTDRIHQYAFVFDRDGDPGDDYIAGGAYPSDTWDHSDLRYELAIRDGRSQVNVTEGAGFIPVSSGARVHIEGDMIMGLLPQDEIGVDGGAVPMRATTFWHLGGFGEGPDAAFNIDLFPIVGEPFWTPTDVLELTGPGAPPTPDPIDTVQFEQDRDRVAARFAPFTAVEPSVDDPSVLAELPECFANDYFYENRTLLRSEREAYDHEGVSIQVRYDAHDSDSAASGASWMAAGSVSEMCRRALVQSAGVGVASVERADDDSVSRVSYELEGAGDGLYLDVYSTHIGSTVVRVTTTGPMNESVAESIVEALNDE